jgi:hypothetical protein
MLIFVNWMMVSPASGCCVWPTLKSLEGQITHVTGTRDLDVGHRVAHDLDEVRAWAGVNVSGAFSSHSPSVVTVSCHEAGRERAQGRDEVRTVLETLENNATRHVPVSVPEGMRRVPYPSLVQYETTICSTLPGESVSGVRNDYSGR